MNKNGPVIFIEDDEDDRSFFQMAFKALGYTNELIFFNDGQEALDYFNNSKQVPFLIISDINMPKLNGFSLKELIQKDADLLLKCVPFIFFTTSNSKESVINAYALSSQGYFIKPNSMEEMKKMLSAMITYWTSCTSPGNFK